MKHPEEVYQRIATTRRAHLDALIHEMHADYMRPMSLNAVAKKYGLTRHCVRERFASRGLILRKAQRDPQRLANGQIAAYVPKTEREITAIIARAKTFSVPLELKFEWRSWSLERRGEFVRRLRACLNPPGPMPTGPFSANVEPFAYGHPRAHAIAEKANAGQPSRNHKVFMMISSQGVIYRDTLYFWAADGGGGTTGAYYVGPWRPGIGRPALHKIIWQEANGRPVPKGHVIRFVDGNHNNLVAENLTLCTRNEVARENQAKALTRKSRALTALLLRRSQSTDKTHDTTTLAALSSGIQ